MPVPRGEVATSIAQVRQIVDRWKRVVLKAQVLTGGRGRAGGIRLANDASEAEQLAGEMFGMNINGYLTSKVLVDEAIDVEEEIYVGVTVDRALAQPIIVASAQGGIEIAEVTRHTPENVYRLPIDPLLGLRAYQVRELADQIGLGRSQLSQFVSTALGLYQAFVDCDAILVEANPLVICPSGDLMSLNTTVIVDDNALFRHRDWIDLRDEGQETVAEQLARRHGISYVRLGGTVGVLSNGAGLAMATIDLLRAHGVRPANFVDVGKGAGAERVARGLHFATNHAALAVLINLFCSVTRCDEIVQGIRMARDTLNVGVPLVLRLEGANVQAGRALLAAIVEQGQRTRIYIAVSLMEAVHQIVALARDSQGE
jgi:succinyl-CoA synthetase beta subunit